MKIYTNKRKMKILMFGWEYPPFHSGGLGTACKGIVEGLMENGTKVTLVLPYIPSESRPSVPSYCVDTQNLSNTESKNEPILISPYVSEGEYKKILKEKGMSGPFSRNLIEEAYLYGQKAAQMAKKFPHDIIHSHDWLTFLAGIEAKKQSNVPFIVHIHSTEFDRSGDNPNPAVYDIEKKGMEHADSIIAVSNYTKDKIIKHYGIPEEKITVIHNAIHPKLAEKYHPSPIRKNDKIVLFLGRITLQKGPDYFLYMAKKILEKIRNVKFVIAGDGDMTNQIIRTSIHLGIEKNVLFTGFLRGKDVERTYQNADVYVMPSVSEPFGLTALEAIQNGAPVLVSKQSGVSEVILNALKVDFWDIDEMANKVISILKYPHLSKAMRTSASHELNKFSWNEVGKKLINLYNNLKYLYA